MKAAIRALDKRVQEYYYTIHFFMQDHLFFLPKPSIFPCKTIYFSLQKHLFFLAKPSIFPCKTIYFSLQKHLFFLTKPSIFRRKTIYFFLTKPSIFPRKTIYFSSQNHLFFLPKPSISFQLSDHVRDIFSRSNSYRVILFCHKSLVYSICQSRLWRPVSQSQCVIVYCSDVYDKWRTFRICIRQN